MTERPIRRAILSVSDKTGLIEFARELASMGVELLSTGGTHRALAAAGVAAIAIEDFTQFPEMLGGRVKTLHPKVFAGILARRDCPGDLESLEKHQLPMIDLVIVNLYPFAATIAKPDVHPGEAIEQIDIGGPSLLRAAAKNHAHATVVCDPADYPAVLAAMKGEGGATTLALRRRLAGKVYAHTALYDATIANYFESEIIPGSEMIPGRPNAAESAAAPKSEPSPAPFPTPFPPALLLALPKVQDLRYGENPHQAAAFYADPLTRETSLARARQLQGKELSYNNILDADGALEAVRDLADLAPAAVVIVKHSNPCGIALGETAAEAYPQARACDPEAAFGGIVGLSVPVDAGAAALLAETFLEVILAPGFTPEALEILRAKKNLRLLDTGAFTPKRPMRIVRGIVGGALVMDRDLGVITRESCKIATQAQPAGGDWEGLLFAWRCVKWAKSNAIVYASRRATVGIGAGQMSRADSARLGVTKARSPIQGCYMASDAFFPFRDSIDAAAGAGVRAIIQPGGSIRDAEVIQAADEHGIIMVFTGMRHFRH